jgi:hypothetical protein
MQLEEIRKTVKMLLESLIKGDFELVFNNDFTKKLSIEDVRDEISSYPGVLTLPPLVQLNELDLYDTNFENQIWIDIPLWFDNEESDLTMSCIIYNIGEKYHYSIEDIHIL